MTGRALHCCHPNFSFNNHSYLNCVKCEIYPQPLLHPSSPSLPDFNLFHMIAVGLSSSILGCLVTLLVYSYCQRYQQQSHDATVIHPISAAPLNTSITNHINKLDKYDSVEAIKVCVLMCCGFPKCVEEQRSNL